MNEKLSNSKIWLDDYSASIENWAKDNGLLSLDGEEVGNRDHFLPEPHFEDIACAVAELTNSIKAKEYWAALYPDRYTSNYCGQEILKLKRVISLLKDLE